MPDVSEIFRNRRIINPCAGSPEERDELDKAVAAVPAMSDCFPIVDPRHHQFFEVVWPINTTAHTLTITAPNAVLAAMVAEFPGLKMLEGQPAPEPPEIASLDVSVWIKTRRKVQYCHRTCMCQPETLWAWPWLYSAYHWLTDPERTDRMEIETVLEVHPGGI